MDLSSLFKTLGFPGKVFLKYFSLLSFKNLIEMSWELRPSVSKLETFLGFKLKRDISCQTQITLDISAGINKGLAIEGERIKVPSHWAEVLQSISHCSEDGSTQQILWRAGMSRWVQDQWPADFCPSFFNPLTA